MSRMPTLFIPHGGGPCFFMDWDPPHTWDKMAAFLRGVPASLPEKPKAVLIISGHWEEAQVTVQTGAKPPLLSADLLAQRRQRPGEEPRHVHL